MTDKVDSTTGRRTRGKAKVAPDPEPTISFLEWLQERGAIAARRAGLNEEMSQLRRKLGDKPRQMGVKMATQITNQVAADQIDMAEAALVIEAINDCWAEYQEHAEEVATQSAGTAPWASQEAAPVLQ